MVGDEGGWRGVSGMRKGMEPKPDLVWEMNWASLLSDRQEELLAAGWEPFAVRQNTLFLKRLKSVGSKPMHSIEGEAGRGFTG